MKRQPRSGLGRRALAAGQVALGLIVGAAALCGAAPVRADQALILHYDDEALQARVDLIQQAREEICVSYYLIGDDDVPLLVLSLLREAARRGVAVRVLVDAHDANNQMPPALQAHLIREGVEIREYHPHVWFRPSWTKHRMHDKLLIVDGEHLITGGRNLKDEYYGLDCQNFIDRDVYVHGHAAACARCYFLSQWTIADVCPTQLWGRVRKKTVPKQAHPELNDGGDEASIWRASMLLDEARCAAEGCELACFDTLYDWCSEAREVCCVRFLHDVPGVDKRKAGIGPQMLHLLSSAQYSLVLETPYMAISSDMRRVLAGLRSRGVQVTILTNSFESTDQTSAQGIYENNKRWLLRQGIELWELRGRDHLHAKAAVIDEQIAVIGSYNFDELSEKKNTEVAAAVYDEEIARMLIASFNVHRQRAYQIGPNARPVGFDTRYPGASRRQVWQMRVRRVTDPLVKRFL